jgi:flagella basal body P-ring formation protein FlgA
LIAVLFLLSVLAAPADVTIDTDTISAGQLIPFPAADQRASTSLGYAPNAGLARRITRAEILNKITAAGGATDDLQLPESILVHRRAASLTPEQVTPPILTAFLKRFPDANIEITHVEIPPMQIGTGPIEINASLPARFDPAVSVFVRIDVRGTTFAKTAFVRTNVRIETGQPILKNKVAAHAEIQSGDIEWKMSPVRAAGPASANAEQVDGMLAKRDLEPGQVVTNDLLYMPLYVRKGDSVTVKSTAGAITISATMRAKAAGKLGEMIPVEHLSGEGSTTARIVGPRILEVNK